MRGDEDTKVAFLQAGDRFRLMGDWYDVERRRRGVDHLGATVVLDCVDDQGRDRCWLLRPQMLLAAECMPRSS